MARKSELPPLDQSVWAAETQCVLECRIIVPGSAPTGSELSLPYILPLLLHRMFQRKLTAGHPPDVRHVLWDSSHICIVTTMHKHIAVTVVTPHNNVGGGRY